MLATATLCLGVFLPFFLPVCNFGENVTTAFVTTEKSIYELMWYACPANQQKCLIIMLAMAQKTYAVNIFGSVDCSRDTFQMVSLESPTNILFYFLQRNVVAIK